MLSKQKGMLFMIGYYLEVILGIDKGKRYPLTDGAVTIGRSDENTIQLNEDELFVSNHHAIFYKDSGVFSIQDMSSKNGTYLNGENISQKEVMLNDIIGFGEKGPQLKLLFSNTEIPEMGEMQHANASSRHKNAYNYETLAEQQTSSCSTASSDPVKKAAGPESVLFTAEIENKLISNQISAEELSKLLHQKERLEKIMQKGNISEAQANLLHSAYGAHRKNKKQALILVSSIVFVSLMVISFFSIRMFQYKARLNIAKELENKLDSYENQIVQARLNGASAKEIEAIVENLEKTKGQFNMAKAVLNEADLQQFYQDTVEQFISEILSRFGETDYYIPPQMLERVKHHLDTYSKRMKPVITRYLKRKETYFPMIQEIFYEKKLPLELAYISMLESGFNPKALSHAGARGLWQFMAPTGRSYGLKINDLVDERIEPRKATYAAAEYLKDLIGIFGSKSSIMLAMAAYNAGENRVMGALRKIDDPMRNRDFWYIYRMGYLAEETNEYIPRILALMIIDENREHFGFTSQNIKTAQLMETESDLTPLNID